MSPFFAVPLAIAVFFFCALAAQWLDEADL